MKNDTPSTIIAAILTIPLVIFGLIISFAFSIIPTIFITIIAILGLSSGKTRYKPHYKPRYKPRRTPKSPPHEPTVHQPIKRYVVTRSNPYEPSDGSYNTYLNSLKWMDIKGIVLGRGNYSCVKCGMTLTLNVHHTTYKNVYHEADNDYADLITLCSSCHSKIDHEPILATWPTRTIKRSDRADLPHEPKEPKEPNKAGIPYPTTPTLLSQRKTHNGILQQKRKSDTLFR